MIIKLVEIRDRATFIPAIAIRLTFRNERERYLLRRAGYASEQIVPDSAMEPYILLSKLDGVRAEYDPYNWGNRTMATAHAHLIQAWDSIASGDVIDVQFILGETQTPKVSEQESHP